MKPDDTYARAWESEYETPIFDNGQHEPDNDNSPETTMRLDLPNHETCTIPGNIQENSPEILPHTNEVGDGTDTDHYVEPDAEVNSEQLSPTDVNPRSTKYDLRQNPTPICNDDCRYSITNLSRYGTRNNCVHRTWILQKSKWILLTEHLRTDP